MSGVFFNNLFFLPEPRFYDHCLQIWRQPRLLDDILKLVISAEDLKSMTPGAKLAAVYQSLLQQEFQDMSEAIAEMNQFDKVLAVSRPQAVKLTADEKLIVPFFFKKVFQDGAVYSLPKVMFDAWRANIGREESSSPEVSCRIVLSAFEGDVPELPPNVPTSFYRS